MPYSNKRDAYYLELARLPCSQTSFTGSDIRFSSEYEFLEPEVGKAQSIHGNAQPDWHNILETSEL